MSSQSLKTTRLSRAVAAGALGIALALGLLGASGCGGQRREVTELQRKEADLLAAEAGFAINLRDWARAEGLLAKAADLAPDHGDHWMLLGSTRVRLGNKSGAREAYQRALKAYAQEAASEAAKNDPEPWLDQIYALAVLGKVGDARSLAEKMGRQFPRHPRVKAFVEGKQLDQILTDPKFKETAL